ncbi:MAG TPA: efflux RND transporter periplasmic adaptor subunit, partial [Candidatus Limnocylindrales bacterium]|nr:efflux RND transporter periplasmic adaptor subunit [Candidatus Limnocylindrales bacterium]
GPTVRPSPSITAEPTPIDNSVGAAAVVVPLRSAELATRISGVVASIYVHNGSPVEDGQLLLKLEQKTYQDAIDVAQSRVDQAGRAVELARLQVEQLPLDASPGQIEFVQASLRLAEADLDLAESRLREAQTALTQTEIRAPFAGTVASVDIELGEQALAGQAVITVGDQSGWLIETTDLSELEVVRIAVGDRATVALDALPELVVNGTVERIQVRGTNDDGGVVFAVSIRPDIHHSELRWGLTATVRIAPSG